jgi:hypothetical protein
MYRFGCVAAVVLLCLAPRAGAIVGGQVSNFEDGTIQGWVTGPQAPLPTNIASGGPTGANDNYLRVDPFTHLGVFSPTSDWGAGSNYTSAGVLDIGVDFLNFNPNTAANIAKMRIVIFGPNGSRWTSNNFVTVPTDNLWHHHQFSLRQADLTQVLAGDTYAATMAAADRLMFRHDDGVSPNAGGTPFTGSIGIDNVTAIVPEPSGLIAMFASVMLLTRRRR